MELHGYLVELKFIVTAAAGVCTVLAGSQVCVQLIRTMIFWQKDTLLYIEVSLFKSFTTP